MTASTRYGTDRAGGRHRALFYGDAHAFVDAVAPFVGEAIQTGDHVLLVLDADRLGWLREAIGAEFDALEIRDASAVYARNGPMLHTLLRHLASHGVPGQGRIRVVAEQALAARNSAEVRAYMRYEAAANVAYEPYDVCVLCPYDTSRLPDAVLQSARQTHPQTLVGSTTEPSPTFADPRAFVRRHSEIERPPADALELPLESPDDIAPARERVAQLAATAGLASSRTEELTVALSEVAANALAHGAAPRRLRVYTSDGAVVCHVQDAGQGLADPLAGYLLPDPMGLGGRGLWLAHQLCDIVEASCDQAGAQVSLRVSLDSAR